MSVKKDFITYPNEEWKTYDFHSDDHVNWVLDKQTTTFATELFFASYERIPVITEHKFQSSTTHRYNYNLKSGLSLGLKGTILMLSKHHRKLWKSVYDYFQVKYRVHKALVIGTPGIGKSNSMIFLLKLLLEKGKLVVYESISSRKVWIFVPTSTKFDDKIKETVPVYTVWSCSYKLHQEYSNGQFAILENSDVYYLIDSTSSIPIGPISVPARTLLVTQPGYSYYESFIKFSTTKWFFIPPFTIEEVTVLFNKLEEMNRLPIAFSSISKEDRLKVLHKRTYLFGAIPLHLFWPYDLKCLLTELMKGVKQYTVDSLTETLSYRYVNIDDHIGRVQSTDDSINEMGESYNPSSVLSLELAEDCIENYVPDKEYSDASNRYSIYNSSCTLVSQAAFDLVFIENWDKLKPFMLSNSIWMKWKKLKPFILRFYEQLGKSILCCGGSYFKSVNVNGEQIETPATIPQYQAIHSSLTDTKLLLNEHELSKRSLLMKPQLCGKFDHIAAIERTDNITTAYVLSYPSNNTSIDLIHLLELQFHFGFSHSNPLRLYTLMAYKLDTVAKIKIQIEVVDFDNVVIWLLAINAVSASKEVSSLIKALGSNCLKDQSKLLQEYASKLITHFCIYPCFEEQTKNDFNAVKQHFLDNNILQ